MRKYLLTILLAFVPALCLADGAKLYTKRARLEDFTAKTTKIVLAGDALLQTALREEAAISWHLSPYEFCSPEDYAKEKDTDNFYFLRPTTQNGIIYLTLTKSGRQDNDNILKRGFDVVSVPMARESNPTVFEFAFIGAYMDIIQRYVEGAMVSDNRAYGNITATPGALAGRKVILNPEEAVKALSTNASGYAAVICIAAEGAAEGTPCYKIAVTCDTHELCYFKKHKISKKKGAGLLESDLATIYGFAAD